VISGITNGCGNSRDPSSESETIALLIAFAELGGLGRSFKI
jgi:hypothetical protein